MAAAADAWFKATGVPLVEALQQLSLQQAGLRSLALVLATTVGVLLGNKLLDLMGTKVGPFREADVGADRSWVLRTRAGRRGQVWPVCATGN